MLVFMLVRLFLSVYWDLAITSGGSLELIRIMNVY